MLGDGSISAAPPFEGFGAADSCEGVGLAACALDGYGNF
jgi:hypothetical protein